MKKSTKVILSSMLAVGTMFGVGVAADSPQVNQAHAATTPYYNYHGYAGNHASFVLDKQFIKSLKYNNFRMNGVHITSTYATKTFKKYDQTFHGVTKSGKSANSVTFDVTSKLTLQQLKQAYGKNLIAHGNNFYIYKPGNDKPGIMFILKNEKVTSISIGF